MTLSDAIAKAQAADDEYSAALAAIGKTRWNVDPRATLGSPRLHAAWSAKLQADHDMHKAFEATRKIANPWTSNPTI